ncbi:MAG: monovalent cation:proton antiporter-2 (CPA2) family protein, partial [Pseudomonadota bacterium]
MAEGSSIFLDAVVLLGGATIAAPLFKKIGLGTVLGYLGLGLLLGPVFNYIHDGESVLHVAELGIVMLLFLVGLELNPSRLWDMRREIFGLGALQVLISMGVIAVIAWAIYFEWQAAVIVGAGLALSSTAFALQLLEDSGDDRLPYGKRSFSILLFQDLAIAPLLVLVPLLAAGTMQISTEGMMQMGLAVASVVALVLAGRYLLNPLFHIIANTGAKEAMIAAALFVVIGSAVLMQLTGLSMAMGAFIAGVMLAESSYRHELEADIEPFRGILLGLFFIAVGLAVDLQIVWDNILLIIAIVPAAMALKAAIIYGLCRAFGSDHN